MFYKSNILRILSINVFHINGMEKYTPKILLNTIYYFDISDVLVYNFRLSLFNDGLNNNTLNEYKTTEVTYKSDLDTNVHLIKLKLLETNINTSLYTSSQSRISSDTASPLTCNN